MTEEGDQTLKRAILSVTVLAVISVIVLFVLRTSGTADKQTPAQILQEITGDGTEFFALHGWETEKVSEKNIKITNLLLKNHFYIVKYLINIIKAMMI